MICAVYKYTFIHSFIHRVARLNSRGGGCFKGHALCYTGFEKFLYRDLSRSFRAQCLCQMEGGLCPAGRRVIT